VGLERRHLLTYTPLFDALIDYSGLNKGYFRIPGHRFERGIPKEFIDFAGKNIFKIDVTETPMSDDLHKPGNVIAESQQLTADAFGAAESFYLVNGTSCGNESMIIATAGEKNGDAENILIPRNAHKSVLAGLIFSGAKPVYVQPDYIEDYGIMGVLKPKTVSNALKKNADIRAVLGVSPSYHGLCCDLKQIADSVHSAGIPFIIDEAHGAHFYFNKNLPAGALTCGADACSQSLHKTAGALTQASLLHIAERSLIDSDRLDSALRMTMSTSPSYILMTSLELARNDLVHRGEELWQRTIELANKTRRRLNNSTLFRCPCRSELKELGAFDLDETRLIVNCDDLEISGYELKETLWNKFHIDVEMADSRNILLLFSYGNTEKEADSICKALGKIAAATSKIHKAHRNTASGRLPAIPESAITPRQAYYSKVRRIPWSEMVGKIAAEPAAPYPPGIPVVNPGEIITQEIFEYLDEVKKTERHLHGISDKALETLKVCEY
jgi:arginine decarboxylase